MDFDPVNKLGQDIDGEVGDDPNSVSLNNEGEDPCRIPIKNDGNGNFMVMFVCMSMMQEQQLGHN